MTIKKEVEAAAALTDYPKISVIMSVYNCEDTLAKAIDSILIQTYSNWEFVICNDCSTDKTQEILDEYQKKYPDKFILLRNEQNMKLPYSLNECLKCASGPLVARMDGDDISEPTRFEEQVAVLLSCPKYQMVGTCARRFDETGLHDIVKLPEYPSREILKKNEPFLHATIMLYKSVFDQLGGYCVSKRTERTEDLDLWFRFFYNNFEGYNIQKPLYLVRENITAIKRRTVKSRLLGLQTAFYGFKLLKFPWYCYVKSTLSVLFKIMIPPWLLLQYRKYQAWRAKTVDRNTD